MRANTPAVIFTTILITGIFCSETAGQSIENIFNPSGKPVILLFQNVNSTFSREGNSGAFEITRAYLGYEHHFSKTLSARIIMDVGDPGTGGLQMTAFIKNAFLKYDKEKFSASIGMIGTDQYSVQEKHWGYRYIYKSFQDEYGLGPSADLGAVIEYSPAKFVSFDASLLNGEGYKKLQSDSALKATFGLTLKPLAGIILRGYYDVMKTDHAQTTIALFAGYTYRAFRAGLEFDIQKNNRMHDQNDLSGISAWAALQFSKRFSVFTRYDYLWSETINSEPEPWNYANDGSLFLAGLDYTPVKGVKIAPVWMGWSPADKSGSFISKIGLWFELRY